MFAYYLNLRIVTAIIIALTTCSVIALPYNTPRSWPDRRRFDCLRCISKVLKRGGKSGLQRAGCQVTPG